MDGRTLGRRLALRLVPGQVDESVVETGDLTAFKRHIYRRYMHAAHLDLLDRKLEAVTRYVETGGAEGVGRLIISMPPRHGKTMTTSKLFPAWFLGRNPYKRVMLVSYGQSLVNKSSRAARNFLNSRVYREVFPAVRLAEDSAGVEDWDIHHSAGEGGVSALGIAGASTGKGAHLMVIDDPHKGRNEAESKVIRDRTWAAFQGDLMDRLEPGGAIVIMATRWHEDDLTGRALREMGNEGWDVFNLPALAHEDDDPVGREAGEALWPERYGRDYFLNLRASVGPYEWAAKYDGDPQPSEGGILKEVWFRPLAYVKPPTVKRVRYWDLAMSEKKTADYTAGLRLDLCEDGEWYVTGMAREQVEYGRLPGLLEGVMLTDGPTVRQGFENKGFMTRAVQEVAKSSALARYKIKGYSPDTDKLTRALPWAARAALRVVHLYVGPDGLTRAEAEAMVSEFKAFPVGEHDDQVDAMSGAWEMINEVEKKPLKARAVSYVE